MARHHMHMQMVDDLSRRGLAELLDSDTVALECLHRSLSDPVGAARDMDKILDADIQDVAGRGLRDHQGMSGAARHDVEKGQHMVVFIDLVAGKLAAQDLREDVVAVICAHDVSLAGLNSYNPVPGGQDGSPAALRNGPPWPARSARPLASR